MNKQEVLDAMASAGLERPRVMLVQDNGLYFEMFAGPNDGRWSTRIVVTGARNCKASKGDVANAIERLKG
jgi:hypothetical protein